MKFSLRLVMAMVPLFLTIGCGAEQNAALDEQASAAADERDEDQVEEQSDGPGRDLYSTSADTDGIRGPEDYASYDERRDDLGLVRGTYDGFGCTEDCDGHDAGYRWAEEQGITDESECGGNSWSFQEGCVAYAEDQQREFAAADVLTEDDDWADLEE